MAQLAHPVVVGAHQLRDVGDALAGLAGEGLVVELAAQLEHEQAGEDHRSHRAQQQRGRLVRGVELDQAAPGAQVLLAVTLLRDPAGRLLEALAVLHAPHAGHAFAQHLLGVAGLDGVDEIAVVGGQRRAQRHQPSLLGRASGLGGEVQLVVVHQRMADAVHQSHVFVLLEGPRRSGNEARVYADRRAPHQTEEGLHPGRARGRAAR
ncbi:hypothetical protein GXN78_21885 [Variovorax sp. WS11]|nr:hypothetical protein [Variovorax sp. WS11]